MINIDVSRIRIALHGISAQVVEAAAWGLEAEIKRRLGSLPRGRVASVDIGELSIGPVHGEGVLDAAALRNVIAQRLVAAIESKRTEPGDTGKGGR